MPQSLSELERDALQLPAEDRAKLAVSLLCSLEEAGEDPEEVEKLWVVEAERRVREIQADSVKAIPAEEVLNRLRIMREMVERGLADADAGRTISNDEMARRIRSWQK